MMKLYKPYEAVSSDGEPFVVPNLPGEIMFVKSQIPPFQLQDLPISRFFNRAKEAELKSYGIVVNSFYELESAYADLYKKVIGRNTWLLGPVSLCNRKLEEKAHRGKEATIDQQHFLNWLDSKKPNSVIYVCFGTISNFSASQLREIAIGLEDSGQQFIWVIKKGKEESDQDYLPDGFEDRVKEKGLIIRGWAPQVLILDHEAVGGFVTHCGWNSALEGISAGLPMVTWPVGAEQFQNEKFLTQILRIGVEVGARKWVMIEGDSVKNDAIERAVSRVMVGEEAEEMRNRANELGKMARRAVEEGGSSYTDLNDLLENLRSYWSRTGTS